MATTNPQETDTAKITRLITDAQNSELTGRNMIEYFNKNATGPNEKLYKHTAASLEKIIADHKQLIEFYEEKLRIRNESEAFKLADRLSFIQDIALSVFDLGQAEYQNYINKNKKP